MNAPFPSEKLQRFGKLFDEYRRRIAKDQQSQRGWYDDNGVRQGGLIAFVRYFWSVLEPETPFVDGWPLWAMCEHLEAVTAGEITRLLINVPPGFMKSMLVDVFWPAWEWGPQNKAHYRYLSFSYSASLTERDNDRFRTLIASDLYQKLYGPIRMKVEYGEAPRGIDLRNKTTIKVMNTRTGWKLASSVGGVATGERATRVLIDDPHSVTEAESDRIRSETIRWFRESISSRFNDLDTGSLIIIMQRVHEEDVSGVALGENFDYCHLMIPWHFDSMRQQTAEGEPVANAIGWCDPRTEDGEAAWPERFSEKAMARTQREVGPFAWCTPGESPVLMEDLSLRPIGSVIAGDKVVGFMTGQERGNKRRARHTVATVLSVSKTIQQVFRITLDSGEVIRCTRDHKWWTGRGGSGRKVYAAAYAPGSDGRRKRGSTLHRVCPAKIPQLDSIEDAHLAGWLAGFFDGEGTVSLLHRRAEAQSALIQFAQSSNKNLILCEKLEAALNHFGFDFGYKDKIRDNPKWQPSRMYYLKSGVGHGLRKGGLARRGSRLTLNQRFLHLIKPQKWRDRLITASTGGRMFTTRERVVSIEPDGIAPVYGLETTTGNYVVWGFASSNSSQYQQSPMPRGGNLFRREWWNLWEPEDGKFPILDYVVASLDGAFTEDEENDPSALTVWGVFTHPETKKSAIMLVHAWRKHLQFSAPRVERLAVDTVMDGKRWLPETIVPGMSEDEVKRRNARFKRRTMSDWGLIEWVQDTCLTFKVDLLLIEAKASGISAAQEISNRYGLQRFGIQLCPVKGDKVARALAVQPTFSQGLVWAPEREWSELMIAEAEVFPKGRYDDLTDSMTQALRYLRDGGMAMTEEETSHEEYQRAVHKPAKRALYPV